MRRREFVAYGSASLLGAGLLQQASGHVAEAKSLGVSLELHLEEIYEELIDGEVVYALAFRDPLTRQIRPPLRFVEGAWVTIHLVNKTRRPRRFAVTGFDSDRFPYVSAGGSVSVGFLAPTAGSYIYHDNSEGAVGRVAGLHGALVVAPANGRTEAGSPTPYANPTQAQATLFDALGTVARFPGEKWRPDLPERSFVWMIGAVDPVLCRRLERDETVDPGMFADTFRPRYFTLNGLSGYDAVHDRTTAPHGYIGEPALIRVMNAAMSTNAVHFHGNHVFVLSDVTMAGGVLKSVNVTEVDTVMVKPMARRDLLLPFKRPDDIPDGAWPPKEETFPFSYPMHCHMEMSQTAGGGNYPQGLITDWVIEGLARGGRA